MTSEQGETDRAGVGDESLADALGAVARQLRDKSAETLAPWDITPAHLRALRTLSRHGTMRLSELSERLQIAPPDQVPGLERVHYFGGRTRRDLQSLG